ncbi:ubiquinol-cytochrome c reductase iron-sulfur subunit [Candidatus Neomarinimicrobiota bacterium]
MTETAQAPGNTDEEKLSRRSLLTRMLGVGLVGWLGAILYPIAKYLTPPPVGEAKITEMIAGMVDDTWEKPFRIIQFGRKPLIFFKDPQGVYRAMAATCTHLACIVQYQPDENVIWCACHNGKFDLTGKVVGGPAPDALEEYDVNITDSGEIWVSQKLA